MIRTFSPRFFFIAAGAAWLLLLFCFGWYLIHETPPAPQTLDVRIAGRPRLTNNAILVSIVLSNGTSGPLNIVDDTVGNPYLGLVTTNYFEGLLISDRVVSQPCANMLKLNLAPGATLLKSVWITNPPPRFRLRALVRDLTAEHQAMWPLFVRSLAVKANLVKERVEIRQGIMPISPWIESGGSQ
jgi:hypothetical protein